MSQKSIFRKEKKSKVFYTKKFSSINREFFCLCSYNTLYTESLFLIWWDITFIISLYSFSQDLGIYLLFHVNPRSTIDVTRLNCCVRKGNRCTPRTIDTKILKKRIVILKLYIKRNIAGFFLFPTYSEIIFIPTFYLDESRRIKSRTKSMYKYRSCY